MNNNLIPDIDGSNCVVYAVAVHMSVVIYVLCREILCCIRAADIMNLKVTTIIGQ